MDIMSSDNVFVTVAKAPADQRAALAATLAPLKSMTVEDFLSKVAGVEEKARKEKEAAERKAAADARNAAISALNSEAEAVTVSLSEEEETALEAILEGIGGLDEKGKACLVVTGIANGDLTFEVQGLNVRTAPKGGGRVAKDAPRPYVDRDGNRVVGWYNTLADNLSEVEKATLDDNPESLLDRNEDGTFKGSKKLERRLVAKGFMVASPL